MKKRVALATALSTAVFALTSSAVLAADAAPATDQGGCCACPADPVVTGDVYLGPASKYLFRGNSLSPNNAFVVQGGIDLTYKAFTLSYWTNFQNKNVYDPNTGGTYKRGKITENDLILDYAIPYKLPFAEKLSFNIGTQYFAVDGIDDTNEFYLKASYETLLSPAIAVYWDTIAATKAGLFYTASVSHTFEIERNLLDLNLSALASYNQHNPSAAWTEEGDGVYSGWHNYELTASLDYKPTASITITPSYMYSDALSDKAKDVGIKDRHVFAVKATFGF